MAVFVEENVAANEMWQKTEDGHADGLKFRPRDVMVLVMYSPEAACYESAVEDYSPTIALIVAMDVGCLDLAVDVLSVGVTENMCPPLRVATELRSEADSSFLLVAKYGGQLAGEGSCSRDREKCVLSMTHE
jgi:hypothetical protein